MKYLCLVYFEEKNLDSLPKGAFDALVGECIGCDEALRQSGHSIAAEALQPVRTATTVRVRDGKVTATDGPFAETKEQLGGFYLIEARDLNEALEAAAKIPGGRLGCIEVRPIWDLRQQEPRSGRP
ncbi:MAG: YciI family protein [Kiloniellales bacterium]